MDQKLTAISHVNSQAIQRGVYVGQSGIGLGLRARSRSLGKESINFVIYSVLSSCRHVPFRLRLEKYSWNFIFGTSTKTCRDISSIVEIRKYSTHFKGRPNYVYIVGVRIFSSTIQTELIFSILILLIYFCVPNCWNNKNIFNNWYFSLRISFFFFSCSFKSSKSGNEDWKYHVFTFACITYLSGLKAKSQTVEIYLNH